MSSRVRRGNSAQPISGSLRRPLSSPPANRTDGLDIQVRSRSRMRDDDQPTKSSINPPASNKASRDPSPSKSRRGLSKLTCCVSFLLIVTCLYLLSVYQSHQSIHHPSKQPIVDNAWSKMTQGWLNTGGILMVSAQSTDPANQPAATPVDTPPVVSKTAQSEISPAVPSKTKPTAPAAAAADSTLKKVKDSIDASKPAEIKQNIPAIAVTPLFNDRPNQSMNQSVFPKTADGYPLFSPPRSPVYSAFYCIGGRGREGAHGDRSCRFQNLCYKPSTNDWLFYQDPATRDQMPVLLDHGNVITEFPPHLVNLRSMGNPEDAKLWAPKQVYEAIPEGARVHRKDPSRPDVHMLYHSHYPSNIGHIIGDDFFPLFNLQLSFGMLTNDVQLIMSRDCDTIFLPGAPKKAQLCHKFMAMLTPGLSRRPVLAATEEKFAEKAGLKAGSDLVCFENVLAGSGPWGFQQSLGKAPSWWQYHHYYLSNMGLSANKTPKKHRITISIKDGKRSIFNNAEMVSYLTSAFPEYDIEAIELYKLGGWQQELAYLQDTSVLITPCGGVSMSSMFLPHGSAMIVVDYWNTKKNNTVGMEERLWSNLGFVRPYHYPFLESEVILDEPGRVRWKYQDMRDWGRVKVDVKRMEGLLRDAIRHVDSFMIKGIE